MLEIRNYDDAVQKSIATGFKFACLFTIASILLGLAYQSAGFISVKMAGENFGWSELFYLGGLDPLRIARYFIGYTFLAMYIALMHENKEKLSPNSFFINAFIAAPIVLSVLPFLITDNSLTVSSLWALTAISCGVFFAGWHQRNVKNVLLFLTILILLVLLPGMVNKINEANKIVYSVSWKLGLEHTSFSLTLAALLDYAVSFYFAYFVPKSLVETMKVK